MPTSPTAPNRAAAAARYLPAHVRLLLVAEAPPCDAERYFYFERVERHDWLFRYVWEGLTGKKPDREHKATHLAALRDAGIFLIDLHEASISQPTLADLRPCVPGLITRIRDLAPGAIILIKSSVYDVAFAALAAADLPVIDARIPFPASGQQPKFLTGFRAALHDARFTWPAAGR